MAPLYDGHDYYKKMFELQEKLRKSEEDRIRLEERFNVLVRESRSRHDICINRLRMRYIQHLEEQRVRDERNHKLLSALDRVMNKLALISAKKDRLNVLRKQYEAYLLRAYHRPPGSVTGDSGIASQNEDKYTKKTDLAEIKGILSPRVHLEATNLQPRRSKSTFASHQTVIDASLNNPISLKRVSAKTSVLHGPHIYAAPNVHQYPQMIPSNYDGSVPRNLQQVPDIRVSHAEAPTLSMDNMQLHAVPGNRFFREHVESAQVASGLSPNARYEERNVPVPRQFDPLALLQYHDDVNISMSDPRSRIREYDPSATAAVGPTLVTGKSSTYRTGSDVNGANQIGPLPGYMDYILANSQKSDDEVSTRSITSDDLDGLIRRNERLWGDADVVKTPRRSPTALGMTDNANLDEDGRILENELDRYISNIRQLHREHGVRSLDELDHEQNTSGDLLNVSLSEDAVELPAEDRVRKERMPEEMGKILALASDLASRTANLKDVARDSAGQNGNSSMEVRRDREIAKSDSLEFAKREAEGRARSQIREDPATYSAKLDQPRGDTRISKESWNNATDSTESRERKQEISTTKKDNEGIVASNGLRIDDPRNMPDEKLLDLVTGKESDIDGLFEAVEESAPRDLASVQKKVLELHLDDSNGDQAARKNVEDTLDRVKEESTIESSQFVVQSGMDDEVENAVDKLPHSEMETRKETSDAIEVNKSEGQNETPVEDVHDVPPKVPSQHSVDEPKIASQPIEEFVEPDGNDGRNQDNDGTTELRVDDQFEGVVKDNEYGTEQGYVEDPSQMQQYEQDPNQQYYDPNVPYEAGNDEYERYADQGYAQEGQEYVEYVDGQYAQYSEDPNSQQYQHYPDAQYEQDPNQAYDYGYDPNQGYGDPNQQYDPNQTYDYTEQVPYDPNQTYQQEYKEECGPDGEDNPVGRVDQAEAEESDAKKSDGDGNELHQADVNEANQKKKKKDVIKSLLDSDTDTTIEKNVSNTESDFDFN